ncbi:HAD-like domain-containing protein [Gongronella butleri]|nr:HAD-like domain-containing protein [Gongronella butleri]
MAQATRLNASKIRLITFDAYNTLFKPRGSLSGQYAHEAAKVGLNISPEAVSKHFGIAYREQVLRAPMYGVHQGMASQDWWAELVYNTFAGAGVDKKELDGQFPKLFAALFARFESTEGYSVFPDVIYTLKDLQRRGFRMGVISNCDERLEIIMKNLKLHAYFDFILPSCIAGFEKPDHRIFDRALELVKHMAIDPSEVLHVGDDFERDYVGALQAGWNAVLLKRIKLSYEDSHPPDATPDAITGRPKSIMSMKDLYPMACIMQPLTDPTIASDPTPTTSLCRTESHPPQTAVCSASN